MNLVMNLGVTGELFLFFFFCKGCEVKSCSTFGMEAIHEIACKQ